MSCSSEALQTEELEPLTQPPASPNDSLVKRCASVSVQRTVDDGAELREQKRRTLLSAGKKQKIRPVSINARGPCDPPKSSRKTVPNKSPGRLRSTFERLACPSPNRTSLLRSSQSPQQQRPQSKKVCGSRGGREKCPLRIAELAEPSKRHCLNTWRELPDTLPDYMLDRLQQRIMDQKPIVQLDEAINFFHIKRKRKRSATAKRQWRVEATDEDIKYLCAVFARNMAMKLMKPINISNVISNEIIDLVNVVSDEISKILKNRQICRIESTSDNDTIQFEISTKIAMWIESILQDAEDRLVQNELRAKINDERRMGKEGHIITLIEKYLRYDKQRDLEEEEGPVLDFIDDLIENVMVGFSPDSNTITSNLEDGQEFEDGGHNKVTDEHSTSEDSKDQDPDMGADGFHDIKEDGTIDTEGNTTNSNDYYDDGDDKIITNAGEHLEKELIETIDSFESENADTLEDNGHTELKLKKAVNDMVGYLNVEQVGISADIEEPSGITNIDVEPQLHTIETMNVNDDRNESNKDDRKVKFTNLDSESGELEEYAKRSAANIEDFRNRTLDNMQPEIIFAPPNHGLLSDADESWPNEHAHGIGIKFSESISKSVTSLGHIEEQDERVNENAEQDKESPADNSGVLKYFTEPEHGDRKDHDIVIKPWDNATVVEDENPEISNTNSTIVPNSQLSENKYRDEPVEMIYVMPHMKVEIKRKPSQIDINDVTAIKVDENNTKEQSTISKVPERATRAFNDNNEPEFAPDYFYITDDGKGDRSCERNANESSTNTNVCPTAASNKNLIYTPKKIGQWEAQRWCNDLERTVDNLCHWYNWIDDVCNKMMTLQQKSVLPSADVKILEIFKEWVELKSDIDNDSALWNKLRKQTEIALQTYRKKSKPKCVLKSERTGTDAIFDMCLDIDSLTMWMDSLMTLTEYCMKCKCKYYSKKH